MERLGDKLRFQSRMNAIKNLNLQQLKEKIEKENALNTTGTAYVEIKFDDSPGLTSMLSLESGKTNPIVESFWKAWGGLESLNVEPAGSSGLKFSWEGVKDCSLEQAEHYRGFIENCYLRATTTATANVGDKRQRV